MTNEKDQQQDDPYLGLQPISDYYLTEYVGRGKIGIVYKAEREKPKDTLACKIIPEGKLKPGWEREIEKVSQLQGIPSVVQYHSHGWGPGRNNRPYTWVLWRPFIKGSNLEDYLKKYTIDVSFVEALAKTILAVLHACRTVGTQHGDLHEGNILISDPDTRLLGGPQNRIWISDFGYGGSHNDIEPKNDYRQTFSIVGNLLRKLDPSTLNKRDRIVHDKIREFLDKKLIEVDATQGPYVGSPEALFEELQRIIDEGAKEANPAFNVEDVQHPDDYLSGEALGNRVDEWRDLFVPKFLAAEQLLSRNVTVLTGARGCGKTMVFRRLTAFMDALIGEPSGVEGAQQFIGFYLNCRDLVEAFPYLRRQLTQGVHEQVIHYFHLCWLSEVCKTLALVKPESPQKFDWLDGLMAGLFPEKYLPLPAPGEVLAHIGAFVENEKERCRLVNLGSRKGLDNWPLARRDFLEILRKQLEVHVGWIGQKPIYFFLDDYTIPITTPSLQEALNPVIFQRRSHLFFKVSTESATSFKRAGQHGKPLELGQDFTLIDLANENLHQPDRDKALLLENIFKPRIARYQLFTGKELALGTILGKTPYSNNDLAKKMRQAVEKKGRKRFLYHGAQVFTGMWSSDIRSMVQIFSDLLRDSNGKLGAPNYRIPPDIQDKCFRAAGGEFLTFVESVIDPTVWEGVSTSSRSNKGPAESFGKHLRRIAETFANISHFELTSGRLVKNQGRFSPKQAFRIEIIDQFDLPPDAYRYYEGLVRWHVFLQDWRGKSVRGMVTPRLYLARVLIPLCNLTFSSHDNLQLKAIEFAALLKDPDKFFEYWKDKRRRRKNTQDDSPSLFDFRGKKS